MRKRSRALYAAMVGLSVLLVVGCRGIPDDSTQAASPENEAKSSEPAAANPTKSITVPAGTAIEVRLVDVLSSATSHRGDKFLAALDQPILVGGWVAVPRGASLTGQVVEAEAAGRDREPQLSITLSVLLVGGRLYEIRTSQYRAPAEVGKLAAGKNLSLSSEMRLRFVLEQPMMMVGGE